MKSKLSFGKRLLVVALFLTFFSVMILLAALTIRQSQINKQLEDLAVLSAESKTNSDEIAKLSAKVESEIDSFTSKDAQAYEKAVLDVFDLAAGDFQRGLQLGWFVSSDKAYQDSGAHNDAYEVARAKILSELAQRSPSVLSEFEAMRGEVKRTMAPTTAGAVLSVFSCLTNKDDESYGDVEQKRYSTLLKLSEIYIDEARYVLMQNTLLQSKSGKEREPEPTGSGAI